VDYKKSVKKKVNIFSSKKKKTVNLFNNTKKVSL